MLKEVARSDANLALVGFRIEIERRLRRLAAQRGIDAEGRSALAIMRELRRAELLPPNVAGGLEELIAFGNRAAHGLTVDDDAAQWVLDVGPSILAILDHLATPTSVPPRSAP